MIPEIDVKTFKKRLDARKAGNESFFVLDVRNPNEQEIALIDGTDKLIPVNELEDRIDEILDQKENEILVYCRSGGRSGMACGILAHAGFKSYKNVAGGVLAWSDLVDPTMKKY
ncbi:rhodanese-like domain-containing protein [Leptospira ognonensis]|uniref:Rhodanese-like domain-containing protein n=1 Tax=Leptospira ognonensis TaxID=2484945 RepID=A0A4R9JWJ7_9LEPT|nr:rhodanese-like domain-containing protein [Leptospira ognonensis]TGL56370.1 rhodanese-like domain-containing protein [Leptospira ognonensis]